MRTHIRIVAGSLRGRKLTCTVNANLRPTPQRVREALFSILGNAVPDRSFIDIFAGTGVVGLEAISRGASSVTFIERDFRLIADLERHIDEFAVGQQARIARTDVYRWIERWQAPSEPVTVFLSPPFRDFANRLDALLNVIVQLQERVPAGSVIVLQAESGVPLDELPARLEWDERRYGRNLLLIWVKPLAASR
ncbi:MAG TPA: RsmD family RNA methyltransferase [Gemmataceae bacterium]|nr:RsmD family RNA methyltransferase [Gemmataceae bacterium]